MQLKAKVEAALVYNIRNMSLVFLQYGFLNTLIR